MQIYNEEIRKCTSSSHSACCKSMQQSCLSNHIINVNKRRISQCK